MRPLAALFALLLTSPLAAQIDSAVAAVDGAPTVVRAGRELYESIDAGFGIEPFDLIESDGPLRLEAATRAPADAASASAVTGDALGQTGFHATIDLAARSRVAIETDATVDLIAGSLGVTIVSSAADTAVVVRFGTITLRSYAATFTATVGPAGALLVVSLDGLVEVASSFAPTIYAGPGDEVEVDAASGIARTLFGAAGPSADAHGVAAWQTRQSALLADRRTDLLSVYGDRYRSLLADLDQRYAALMDERSIIDAWTDESRRGVVESGDSDAVASLDAALGPVSDTMLELEPIARIVTSISDPNDSIGKLVRDDASILDERFAEIRLVQRLRNAYAAASGAGM